MNWKRVLLNLGGTAAAGFGGAIGLAAPDHPLNWKAIIAAAAVPVAANVIGLFQQPPHQGG